MNKLKKYLAVVKKLNAQLRDEDSKTRNRQLRFRTLDEAEAELDRLSRVPVNTLGNWSFYQILKHLRETFEHSISAYPLPPAPWPMRLYGKYLWSRLKKQKYPRAGFPNPTVSSRRLEGDADAEYFALKAKIREYREFQGKRAAHPLFGRLPARDWEIYHAYHCALHLSFVQELE